MSKNTISKANKLTTLILMSKNTISKAYQSLCLVPTQVHQFLNGNKQFSYIRISRWIKLYDPIHSRYIQPSGCQVGAE